MKRIIMAVVILAVLMLTGCGENKELTGTGTRSGETVGGTEDSVVGTGETGGAAGQTEDDKGFRVVDRPEGKLPTVVLYEKDGVKVTLSEPDPELLKKEEAQKEMSFERAGMLTLENGTDIAVGIGSAELYVNRIRTNENMIGMVANAGKTERFILDLTLYQDAYYGEGTTLLENAEIYSVRFQCSMFDVNAGWVPFDDFDRYIAVGEEEKQKIYLEKLASEENLCFENEDLAIYFLNRYYPENYKIDTERTQKYYEFIVRNKTNKYLTFYETEDMTANGTPLEGHVGMGGGISAGNYKMEYSYLDKISQSGEVIMQYDQIKYVFYYGLSDTYASEDTKESGFEFVFHPADFGLETTSAPDELEYRKYGDVNE